MDRDALVALISHRRVLSPASVHDPLGLAIELLRPDSITRALQSAHRGELAALHALVAGHQIAEPELQQLLTAGLLGTDSRTGSAELLPEVTNALSGVELTAPRPAEPGTTSDADTSGWYGAALTSVRRAAHLLRLLTRRSAKLGRKGKLSAASLRDLAEAVQCDPEAAERLITVMRGSQLLAEVPWNDGTDHLVTSRQASAWLTLDYADRWVGLAATAAAHVTDRLRHNLAGYGNNLGLVVRHAPNDFPLLPAAELESLQQVADTVEDLGLTVHGQLTPAGLALLGNEVSAATALAHQDIPGPVEGVYVQPDLSIIVPGPLLPADEAALSVVTDAEHLGPAASLRVSATSLDRAVRAGLTPAEIREFLQRISLTGVPQPLDYLLGDLERKASDTNREPSPHQASTPTFTTTHRALPHHPEAPHFNEAENTSDHAHTSSRLNDELAAMVDRVFTAAQADDDDADMLRRLELAIRDKIAVQVTAVAGPDERVFELLPVSLRGGRLRATDQVAGVERTLPVSAITAVEKA